MIFTADEILETLDMILSEHLDIRTVTVGVNLMGCVRDDPERMAKAVHDQIVSTAANLCSEADRVEARYSLPIVEQTHLGNSHWLVNRRPSASWSTNCMCDGSSCV